jgi:hypothetical protein
MGDRRGAYRVLVKKREGKRPLGRSRRRWEVDIKMALQEAEWMNLEWIDLSEDTDIWRAL